VDGRTIWDERCWHGNTRHVDATYDIDGYVSPKRTIFWYDQNGNLEKVTGWESEKYMPKDLEVLKTSNVDV